MTHDASRRAYSEQWTGESLGPFGKGEKRARRSIMQGAASVSPYNRGLQRRGSSLERRGIHEELYIQGGRQGLSRRKRRDDGPVLRPYVDTV